MVILQSAAMIPLLFPFLFLPMLDALYYAPPIVFLVFAASIVACILLCFSLMGGKHLWAGRTEPETYKRGIEPPWVRGIPYEEVASVNTVRGRIAVYAGQGRCAVSVRGGDSGPRVLCISWG